MNGQLAEARNWERVRIDTALLAGQALGETIEKLHRAWACRQRVIVELDLTAEELASLREPEIVEQPGYLLGAEFSLLTERLHFLLWRNNYDARSGEPVWWWAHKAIRLGARLGGRADVMLTNGNEAWIDGGPRQPLDLSDEANMAVVAAESLSLNRLVPQPQPVAATGDGTLLAPDQQLAVEHSRGALRVVAPAGSGKTRTLTSRLLHLVDDRGVEPSLITAVAYNSRAAEEMRQRLQRPKLQIRTIHSLGWRIVRDRRPDAVLIEEREARNLLQRLLPHTRKAGRDTFAPYLEALADVRIALQHPERVEVERNDVPGFAGVFEAYRASLADRDNCDHDEQVYEAIRLLLVDPELRARWQQRCQHLLVDEFQDLTPAYLLLLRLLASPALNVFGVGDDDQTIYGFAGADPGFLLRYERLFPGAGQVALEVSYRCPPTVVAAVGHLLANNERRIAKTVRAAAIADPDADTFKILRVPDEVMAKEAAEVVAGWLAAGTEHSDIVVLGRVNSMLLPPLAALNEAGVATRCRLKTTLRRRTLVSAALAWIRLALRPEAMNSHDLIEAARRPGRKINQLSRELLGDAPDLSLQQLKGLGLGLTERQRDSWGDFVADIKAAARLVAGGCDSRRIVDFLLREVGLGRAASSLDSGRTRPDRAAHVDDLVALRRTAAIYGDPSSFERQLLGLLRNTSTEGNGVLLTTIHRVKGLEWDRVLVFGADRTLLPHHLASDIEEERRVLHVAVTRGRKQVVVLADESNPSRFLAELEGHPAQPAPKAAELDPQTVKSRFPRPSSRPDQPDQAAEEPYDIELFEALRVWRLEEARRREVSAFIVFYDRTLKEIARRKPTTRSNLATIAGVGTKKLNDYAETVLAIVRAHSRK